MAEMTVKYRDELFWAGGLDNFNTVHVQTFLPSTSRHVFGFCLEEGAHALAVSLLGQTAARSVTVLFRRVLAAVPRLV
ncbi:hypothetical protein EVAR_78813_1 [Eumeta japonica]|uniref:Uncharacterized protein n=1 Tax=Eumeta variegata TaxID=151549 RepID=A0A4C1T2D7_EUMVA|nr:hypothetical protein EVAR_78813_1 [Eumeta japonica]